MKTKIKEVLIVLGQAVIITFFTLLSISPIGCKVTTEGIKILEGDYSPPILQSFSVLDEFSMELIFSEPVELQGCVVSPVINGVSDSFEHSNTESLSVALKAAAGEFGSIPLKSVNSEKSYVNIILEQETVIGENYELYGKVKDGCGNTLTFCIPFTGFNSRQAKIIITEIQSESISSQKSQEKANGTYRNEFVEFLALTDGNLAGLELMSAYDGEDKKYTFPPVEVKAGEVFVVHLRNRGNGCVSELSDDLSEATASYSNDNVRDLWSEQKETALGNKTDIIVVCDNASKKIIDAFMYRAATVEEWTKNFVDFSEIVNDCDIFVSGGVGNAFVTEGLTSTKTIVRLNALDLQNQIINGEEIEFPVIYEEKNWSISSEATPGHL